MPHELKFRFPLKYGLHARPASAFQDLANTCASAITLVNEESRATANGKSTLALISTMTKEGDRCTIRIDGADCDRAAEAFRTFLADVLPYCDDDLPAPAAATAGELHLPRILREGPTRGLHGAAVSTGIACAPAFCMDVRVLALPEAAAHNEGEHAEVERLDKALAALGTSYYAGPARRGTEAEIVKAHFSIVRDVEFHAALEEGIRKHGLSAGQAIMKTAEAYATMLGNAESAYLRERAVDIRDVASQIMDTAYGVVQKATAARLTAEAIIVAENLTPSQFMALDKTLLRGLALAHAGATSHTVILARSLGIPCVTGIPDVTRRVTQGETVVLDAVRGILVPAPTEAVLGFYRAEMATGERIARRLRQYALQPATTADGRRIEVAANAASVEEVEKAFRDGAEGIGLFRTEMLFMDRAEPPGEEEQYGVYAATMRAAGDRPVIFRTMDIGGDKGVEYLGLPAEENPFLGFRAVRLYPAFKELINAQLRALLRASASGKAKIMIPMIASVEEVRMMRTWIDRVKGELSAANIPFNSAVEIGIMLEIPSAAFVMDQLAPLVDFFSIGSNDLTQYFLAVDRGNPRVRNLYSSTTPSFLRLLKMIVDGAHRNGRWVGLCGELGGRLPAVPLFLGLGLDEISMASPGIPAMKERIAQYTVDESTAIVSAVLGLETPGQVDDVLLRAAGNRASGKPLAGEEIVVLASQSVSKETVIRELVNALFADGRIGDPDAIEDAVWRREETCSTGIGFGVAIPHCKSASVHANSIALLRPAQPFRWAADDEKPVGIIILLAINDAAPGDEHLRIIAKLSRRLMHDAFRQQLLEVPTAADIVAALRESMH
jgi:multiphosphoryl transfer protein